MLHSEHLLRTPFVSSCCSGSREGRLEFELHMFAGCGGCGQAHRILFVRGAEVVAIGTKIDKGQAAARRGAHQMVIDLINLEPTRRPQAGASYEGIGC